MKAKGIILFLSIAIIIFFLFLFGTKKIFNKQNTPIYIAVIGPMSGVNAPVGKAFVQGVNLYLDSANNSKAKSKQRKVVLDIYDDKNDRKIAKEKAIEIVGQNRAIAVIGHHYSSCSISAGEIYKKNEIPAISPVSTNINVTLNNDWYFRTVFNDQLQGRFLANYAYSVLKQRTVSIIHEDLPYGSFLADVFAKTSTELGGQVKQVISFNTRDKDLDQSLKQIVLKHLNQKEVGLIFLATHAPEGIKLIKEIKEAGIKNPIMVPDAFASKAFPQGFQIYPQEKMTPGYYTDGIYVTTPLITDSADEVTQHFQKSYTEKYKEGATWRAAFSYDAAMVLLDAIHNSKISRKPDDIKNDRKIIRDHLAAQSDINKALKGVTGYNYFDKKGDCPKPVSIGIFKKAKIITALTQLQPIIDLNEILDFEKALEAEQILPIDGQYMYKTNVIYTGFNVNEISDIDMNNLVFSMDFHLWFRFKGNIDPQYIDFLNAVEPVEIGKAVQERIYDGIRYQMYHIKGKFKADFLPGQYVFGQHVLGVNFRHRELARNNLIYVIDVLGMGLDNNQSLIEKMMTAQIVSPASGWMVNQIWFSQDGSQKHSMGLPEYLKNANSTVEYSRFNASIQIKKKEFTLRGIIPKVLVNYLLILSAITVLLLRFMKRKEFYGIPIIFIWFFQVFFSYILLLCSEVVFIDALTFDLNRYYLGMIDTTFDMLWWLLSAALLNMTAQYFLWKPVARRTERKVPNIIRHFLSFILYVSAILGIIAFVYDQKITSLLATSGVIAMIIGLAIQMNISNIFSGIAINMENPFRINDWVKIGSFDEGKILDITWRTTRFQTRNGCVMSIPNSLAAESAILNFSYPDEHYHQKFTIHVDPSYPPERVKKILFDAAMSAEGVLSNPQPTTRYLGLTAGITGQSESWAANYLISVYVKDYANKFAYNEAVWTQVWKHLNCAGIKYVTKRQEIHFPEDPAQQEKVQHSISIIKNMNIFQPFSEDEKLFLYSRIHYHNFATDEIIARHGDEKASLFIIAEGVVSVRQQIENGESIEISRLGTGDFFGELLTGESRTTDIQAISDGTIFEINKTDIAMLIEKHPDYFQHIGQIIAQRKLEKRSLFENRKTVQSHEKKISIIQKLQQIFGFKNEK